MKNRNILTILLVLTIIFTIMGGSLAYFTWQTSEAQKTNVTFTVEKQFSCSADGGGNITGANFAPTDSCTGSYALKRTIKSMPQITGTKTIYMDLWLDINEIGTGLTNSNNLKYALTTSSTSCTTGVVSSGTFNGATKNSEILLLSGHEYTKSITDTYYLYIWLDSAETSTETMNQSFNVSLNGKCTDDTQASSPDLDDGLIPVVVTGNGQAMTINKDYDNWYSYDNKQWANAVMVTSNSRANYKNTSGVFIPEDDILAYYVWIPRYKYAIPSVYCSTVSNPTVENYPTCYKYILSDSDKTSLINWWQSYAAEILGSYTMEQATSDVETGMSTGTITAPGAGDITFVGFVEAYNRINDPDITYTTEFSPSNKMSGPREISISFENKNAAKSIGDAIDSNYRTHPAFTFGDNELNGIWVGKFETTGDATTPTVKPNLSSLRNQNVSTQFSTAQKFGTSTYGSTSKIDAHMMKNSEWGAVAYLSHSIYGINEEIYINNSYKYYTGRSGGPTCTSSSIGGTYTWDGKVIDSTSSIGAYASDRTLGTKASTTGNITGVYDMSGGAYEYVMGYYSGASTTWGASSNSNYAGFSSKPDSKYYDDYTTNNSLTACNGGICYGHALSETANWYSDGVDFVYSSRPWFRRGGYYGDWDGADASAFNSGNYNGDADSSHSFRLVLSAA